MRSFKELGIKRCLTALENMGFTEPFPIQEQAIPILLAGKDVIGQAQTGTGKTAAFGLPILEMMDEYVRDTQALIIVPTRELAMQVAEEMRKFSGGRVGITAVFGGESIMKQISFLKRERQIVVATPGRMLDYMRDDIIPLHKIRFVVLDEADRMLDMGFIEDVRDILKNLPAKRQTSMFSATMPRDIVNLAHDFLNNPEKIIVSKDEISNVMVKQFYMQVHEYDKLNHLCALLKDNKKTIVFCATKMRTKNLANDLHMRGFDVQAIEGDMEQAQRTRTMNSFKEGHFNILIATDVVARGIDVPTVERVINYDVPNEPLVYFHRIGRTARALEKGSSITFMTEKYRDAFSAIVRETKVKIEKMPTPTVQDFPVVRGSVMKEHPRRFGGRKFGGRRRFGSRQHPSFNRDRRNSRRFGRRQHR